MKIKVINVCKNKMEKENKELQKNIAKAIKDLGDKILQYYSEGIRFECIYNAENVKYDKHGECFYTYKAHGRNHSQVRVLYSCVQKKDVTYIIVVDYIEKRKKSCKGHRDHLEKFSKYDNLSFSVFCSNHNLEFAG